jgi:NRPS condensation-like uncharacterized protein
MGMMREYFRMPNNVALVATINGCIKKDDLLEILRKLAKMHPLMKVRVLIDSNNVAWFTNEGVEPISLKILTRKSDKQWMEIVENEYKNHFDFEKGPLIRFILLQSKEESDLIIVAQHIICDGISLTNLVRDVLVLLNQPDTIVKKLDPILPVKENFPVSSTIQFRWKHMIDKIFVGRLYREWKKQLIIFDKEDYRNIIEANSQKFNYKIISAEFSRTKTDAIINKCRQEDVTVNSAILVAFFLARDLIRGSDAKNSRVQIAVNIRNRLNQPANNVFGFLASSVSFEFEYDNTEDFWDNVNQFHQKVLNELKGDKPIEDLIGCHIPTLSEAVNFAIYGQWVTSNFSRYPKIHRFIKDKENIAVKRSIEKINNMPGLLMSNLGQLKIGKKSDEFKVNGLHFAGSASPFVDLTIAAVTGDGKLSLTQNYLENKDVNSDNLNKEMEKIMDKAIDTLWKAVNEK